MKKYCAIYLHFEIQGRGRIRSTNTLEGTIMPQGRNKKLITKRAKKGSKGFPVATIAYYGSSNKMATKIVCGIIKAEGAEVEPIKKWLSQTDIRKSEKILGEVLSFIKLQEVKSVAMNEKIIGCPHEEGIDYPEDEYCPKCSYWKSRDRFSHERIH